MFPEWTWIVGFMIGASVGSFLNVVIYRLPRGLSINKPRHSFCPSCKKQLTWRELIPLASWAMQGGKCRFCQAKVSPRYFIVELVTGILFAAIWWRWFAGGAADALVAYEQSDIVTGVGFMLFAAALVAAIGTDLAHYIIPDEVNAFMLVTGLGMNVARIIQGSPNAWLWGMPSSVVGALVGTVALWGIAFLGRLLFRKDAMGHGDIKMARGIGAVLLPLGAGISFGLAVILGAVIGAIQVWARSRFESRNTGGGGEVKVGVGTDGATSPDDEDYEPESLGSLLKCGLGYLACFDAIGLLAPKFYESWFGENPYAVEEITDEPEVEHTMIPFGPYLALGALGVVLWGPFFVGLVESYVRANFGE